MFNFTDAGAEKFAKVTGEHIDEVLNIVIDGEIISSPIINAPITDGKAMLEGNFTKEEISKILDKIQE